LLIEHFFSEYPERGADDFHVVLMEYSLTPIPGKHFHIKTLFFHQ